MTEQRSIRYVNIGGHVQIEAIPDIFRASAVLLAGDTFEVVLSLGHPEQDIALLDQEMAKYPGMVVQSDPRARAYYAEIEAVAQAQCEREKDRRERAREWLEEHGAPDYVMEYFDDQED